jgi:hypothetical protein
MSDLPAPFTFLATYEVLPGRGEVLAGLAAEYAAAVDANEPQTSALGLYLDDPGSTFTHIQVLASPEAMEAHLGQIQDYLARAAELVRIRSIDVYGDVGPRLGAALDHNRDAGAAVTVHDGRSTGFGRVAS